MRRLVSKCAQLVPDTSISTFVTAGDKSSEGTDASRADTVDADLTTDTTPAADVVSGTNRAMNSLTYRCGSWLVVVDDDNADDTVFDASVIVAASQRTERFITGSAYYR